MNDDEARRKSYHLFVIVLRLSRMVFREALKMIFGVCARRREGNRRVAELLFALRGTRVVCLRVLSGDQKEMGAHGHGPYSTGEQI